MAQSVLHPYGNPIPCFKLKQGTEVLTDHAGLALVGLALAKFARVCETLDKAIPKRSGLSVGEIVTAYVGLLCTGKSDFDAIENHRQDGFFAEALGLSSVPAASTLRMQLDAQADGLLPLADELSVALLKNAGAPITPLACGLVPLDIDVFTQDNGRTRKEGVSRTYAGTDGYAPIAVYLGQEGWCVALELREGSHFSSRETEYTLERSLPRAQALTAAGLLVRWDSGFHAAQLSHQIEAASVARQAAGGEPIHFLVKGNPRRMDIAALHTQRLDKMACQPREGKRLWVWEREKIGVSSNITTFSFGLLQTSAPRDLPSCSAPQNGARFLPSYKRRIGKLELSPDLYPGGASGIHPATKRPIFDGPLKLPVALLDFWTASGVPRKHCHPATVDDECQAWG